MTLRHNSVAMKELVALAASGGYELKGFVTAYLPNDTPLLEPIRAHTAASFLHKPCPPSQSLPKEAPSPGVPSSELPFAKEIAASDRALQKALGLPKE